MEHSSYIYLMDPDGCYVTLFSHDETAQPDEMAARLRQLMGDAGRNVTDRRLATLAASLAQYSKST